MWRGYVILYFPFFTPLYLLLLPEFLQLLFIGEINIHFDWNFDLKVHGFWILSLIIFFHEFGTFFGFATKSSAFASLWKSCAFLLAHSVYDLAVFDGCLCMYPKQLSNERKNHELRGWLYVRMWTTHGVYVTLTVLHKYVCTVFVKGMMWTVN